MIILLVLLFCIDIISSVCPNSNLIAPCTCDHDQFTCNDNDDLDLVKLFQTLANNLNKTQKHFKDFWIKNRFITELKENTFSDITFDTIFILSSSQLKSIHRNAFNTTDSVTTEIYIRSNPLLTSPDNSIFEAVSKFVRATVIDMSNNNITEIPSNAFQDIVGEQDQLKHLLLSGESFGKLGNNAFSQLKNLTYPDMSQTSIYFIPENAFEFNEDSEQQLTIDLTYNRFLDNSGFSMNSLTRFRRPTKIYLPENFRYLDKDIFLPFLTSNNLNRIQLSVNSIDCWDCRNQWIQNDSNLVTQISPWTCSNDISVTCKNVTIIWKGNVNIVIIMVIL